MQSLLVVEAIIIIIMLTLLSAQPLEKFSKHQLFFLQVSVLFDFSFCLRLCVQRQAPVVRANNCIGYITVTG